MSEPKTHSHAGLRPRVVCRHHVSGLLPLGFAACEHALSVPAADRVRLDPIDDASVRSRSYGLLLCPACSESRTPATILVCEHDADAEPV